MHLDDPDVTELENYVLSRTSNLAARVVVFRPGHVLSRHSAISRLLRRLAFCYPLVPERLCSCFVEGTELFAAIEAKRLAETRGDVPDLACLTAEKPASSKPAGRAVGGRNRAYTLLGANRPWRDILVAHQAAFAASDS